MCNRYASDIRKAGLEAEFYGFEEFSETRIKLNSLLEVFPNSVGPVIRQREDGAREWTPMRWGLPGPSSQGALPVTNVRNLASPHWRSLLGPEHRCLVPWTAFSEYDDASPKGAKVLRWFAPPDRSMLMFAGLWRVWRGDRGTKKEPNVGEHVLFSFLTTEANDVVRPVHAKAMPVILRTEAEYAEWLAAPADHVEVIQARVLPSEALEVLTDDQAQMFAGAYYKVSWKQDFEGHACDAVLRHLERRHGTERANLRSPEKDRHAAPVEFACEIGSQTFALEHTTVEAFDGQIQNDVHFAEQMSPITARLASVIPSHEQWELMIPADAMHSMRRQEVQKAHDAVVELVSRIAPTLPAEPWGALNWPVTLGAADGSPFEFRLRRFVLGDFQHRFATGATIVRTTPPLEEPREQRMAKVCRAKHPKLAEWRKSGARTILILESSDFILTNPQSVAEAYLAAELETAARPDEVYFVWTLPPDMGAWRISAIRVDDRTYADIWRDGDNMGEIDMAPVRDIRQTV